MTYRLLTPKDIEFAKNVILWIKTANEAGYDLYGKRPWYPNSIDIEKSRLFWRIRTGKKPLDYPPPRAYSCPWYEVVEDLEPHYGQEFFKWEDGKESKVVLNQCVYDLIDEEDDGSCILGFGPWRFKVWKMKQDEIRHECFSYAIQRMPELERK